MSHSVQPEELLARAQSGSTEAIGELVGLYRNYLSILARVHIHKNLQAKTDPSDLVQETCLLVARSFQQFRGRTEGEFVVWLQKILAHSGQAMIREYRHTQKRDVLQERQFESELHQSATSLGRMIGPSATTPSQSAARREASVLLADALATLPEDYRDVMVLYHLEGKTLDQVAKQMDRTVASVKALRARAIIKLRRLLENEL